MGKGEPPSLRDKGFRGPAVGVGTPTPLHVTPHLCSVGNPINSFSGMPFGGIMPRLVTGTLGERVHVLSLLMSPPGKEL